MSEKPYVLIYVIFLVIAGRMYFDFNSEKQNEINCFKNLVSRFDEEPQKPSSKQDLQLTGPIIKMNISVWGDSGFVLKNELLPWVLEKKITDSIGTSWSLIKADDTLGKYYKTKDSTYYLCFLDLSNKFDFETHIILEISSSGTILKNVRFIHWNYPSWLYLGFKKIKNYYYLPIYGTGAPYSSQHFYLFETLKPQNEMTAIPQYCWTGFSEHEGFMRNVQSDIILDKNNLTMKYKFIYSDEETEKPDFTKNRYYTLYFKRRNDVWYWQNKNGTDNHWPFKVYEAGHSPYDDI